MSKRVGVFIDVANLYYTLMKKFDGRKLDYEKYLEFLKSLGDIQHQIAYGSDMGDGSKAFISYLQRLEFQTKYKPPKVIQNIQRRTNCHVDMTIDILEMLNRLDLVIIGSSNSSLEPLAAHIKRKGVIVVIFACRINRELRQAATKSIEITESMLEVRRDEVSKTEG